MRTAPGATAHLLEDLLEVSATRWTVGGTFTISTIYFQGAIHSNGTMTTLWRLRELP
jgi:hypothetical protein